MTLKQTRFELGLLTSHIFVFQVFNITDNLKGTRATHWFLGLNESFTELKGGNKSLLLHVFEKIFCHQFYSNGSVRINSAWQLHPNASKPYIKEKISVPLRGH